MSAPASLRTKPVDRRRLDAEERGTYRPNARRTAIAKAKQYKANWSANQQRRPFATEQKPGSGGFKLGRAAVYTRQRQAGDEKRRAESFRPENSISRDIYRELAT